ncbi:MAG: PD-(D/E)XK nuclease domain-containing protein [Elusimicrobiota bacterium]|jgi:hypothetical protein|nr:PD-(D/E)XK nuclease domain-containing protein [Elusimicrobiota bacterium]
MGIDQAFENESFSKIALMNFNPEQTTTTALLFQTGYLTIKEKTKTKTPNGFGINIKYLLSIPNYEVRHALAQHILLSYLSVIEMERIINMQTTFIEAVQEKSDALLSGAVKGVIDKIPWSLHNDNEAYYHSILLASMGAMGFKVKAEVSGGGGRADIVWECMQYRIVMELKYLKSDEKKTSKKERGVKEKAISEKLKKLAEQAVNQIKEKKYYADYKNNPEIKIILVGVAVDGKDKIVETKIEII